MTSNETKNWKINIENALVKASEIHNASVIQSIFTKYNAHGLHDLPSCYFSEVFADLEMLVTDY